MPPSTGPTLPFPHGSRTADKAGDWHKLRGRGFASTASSRQHPACGNKLKQDESETAAQREAEILIGAARFHRRPSTYGEFVSKKNLKIKKNPNKQQNDPQNFSSYSLRDQKRPR